MERKTCFFIGHREAPDSLLPILDAEVERHITEFNVMDFVVGRYGRFDSMAARCVKAAKKRHPEVTLTLLLPHHPYDQPIPTPSGYDATFYPPGMETVPDFLIAYVWHPASNARELVEYAKRRKDRGKIRVSILPRH